MIYIYVLDNFFKFNKTLYIIRFGLSDINVAPKKVKKIISVNAIKNNIIIFLIKIS